MKFLIRYYCTHCNNPVEVVTGKFLLIPTCKFCKVNCPICTTQAKVTIPVAEPMMELLLSAGASLN